MQSNAPLRTVLAELLQQLLPERPDLLQVLAVRVDLLLLDLLSPLLVLLLFLCLSSGVYPDEGFPDIRIYEWQIPKSIRISGM